jgi:prepilin-type N-terminal cleavage/methylation domain-containing protein
MPWPLRRVPKFPSAAAFTLVELLVVVAIVALLVAVLLPALSGARQSALNAKSGSNLRQLGMGIQMYLNDYPRTLPQMRVDQTGEPVPAPEGNNIGALFGGKLGTLPALGIDRIGAARRPLNPYVWDGPVPDDESEQARGFELDFFNDPQDLGTRSQQLALFNVDTSSLYDLVGTSYTLNDHSPDDDPFDELFPTLIPEEGGFHPRIRTPSLTWLVGDQSIYNYDNGDDARMYWRRDDSVRAALVFWDGHAKLSVPVPEGPVPTTDDYTFLPSPDWLDQFTPPDTP